ncbi:MAG: hypothetical protein A2Y38_14890 [Spirochaetes bacterium GWB1_59_5]|nr:MAG: hypothetical protein A2Y38_14890 [Spirochaetes bacterium GWB1_59_5]
MATKKKYPEPYRRPDSKIYYFMYLGKDEKRHRMTTGLTAKEDARNFIRAFIDEQSAESTLLNFANYSEPYFIPETCPHFIRYRQEGKSIGLNHLSQCRTLLVKHVFKDPVFPKLAMAKIKRGDLLDLRRRLQAGGMGVNSLNKCISTVKTILSEACFRGDIENNPGSMVGNIKYERQERGVLNPEEVGSFLAFLSERTARIRIDAKDAVPIKKEAKESRRSLDALQSIRDEALIAVLFCSGMRAGEIRALRWSSVDLKTGRCKIIEADKGKDGIGKPKWGKTREIVLAKLALDRLKVWKDNLQYKAPDEYFVFGTSLGKGLGYEGLHNVLEDCIKEARAAEVIPADDRWVSPHAARHTLNTNLLAAGVAPLLVQSFLGWSSAEARILTRVQAVYTHLQLLRVDDVAKAVDLMYAPPKKEAAANLG